MFYKIKLSSTFLRKRNYLLHSYESVDQLANLHSDTLRDHAPLPWNTDGNIPSNESVDDHIKSAEICYENA